MYLLSEWKSWEAVGNGGVGGKQSINHRLSWRSSVGSNRREALGAHCVHQWGLARWFIFISKYSVWYGRNIVVFAFELLLWCVSNAIRLNVFAKPKRTSLFILERWGANGKGSFSSLSGFVSSVYRHTHAVRTASTRIFWQEWTP